MKKIILIIFLFLTLHLNLYGANGEQRSIHVFVALCDNIHQGIVPVPSTLGNGKKPDQNLYWGALYGVKTYFKKSSDWTLVKRVKNPKSDVLERCVFKKLNENIYLVADAYDGEKIKSAITQFLQSSSDILHDTISIKDKVIGTYGNANLIAYIGHNGLMDFPSPSIEYKETNNSKDVIILACKSRPYFEKLILSTSSNPLLLTNGLMAPEAYTLKSAIDGWAENESNEEIRLRAVNAYRKYQKTSFKAADNLFYTRK